MPTLTRGTVTWPDVCDNVIRVSLSCGESVVNWPFAAICRLSSVLAITRRSIDTVSCSNYGQMMCSRKCSLFLLSRGCDANIQSCQVHLCKIMNTSIYYVFITTRSYVVPPMPVGPSCSPLDGDERHDRPLLHASPGSQYVAQLLYRFWNRNPARIVLPGRLTKRWHKPVSVDWNFLKNLSFLCIYGIRNWTAENWMHLLATSYDLVKNIIDRLIDWLN